MKSKEGIFNTKVKLKQLAPIKSDHELRYTGKVEYMTLNEIFTAYPNFTEKDKKELRKIVNGK